MLSSVMIMKLIIFVKSVNSLLTHCGSQQRVNLPRHQSKSIFCTVPSLENLDILDKDWYLDYNPMLSSSLTNLMKGLSDSAVRKLDSNIDLITLSECDLPNHSIETSRQFIYARSFYPELLKQIRKYKRVVLLSNPGTGKSMFQFYYLARLLNPTAFHDPLPPDSNDSSIFPEVVIRQIGTIEMQVFFLKAKVAHVVPIVSSGVLDCFDPETTLYFFEPGGSRVEPMWDCSRMSIFTTCAPDEVRYKQFFKNGGEKLYMPLFTLSELQTIGKHMREQPDFPSELKNLYSDEGISTSYNEYGGIIRHVLPTSLKYVEMIKRESQDAFNGADWRSYIRCPSLENLAISPFVINYVISPLTFKFESYKLVNDAMKKRAENYFINLPRADQIYLMMNSNKDIIKPVMRLVYEEEFSSSLIRGVKWNLVNTSNKQNHDRAYFSPILKEFVKEEVKFEDMKLGVLYKPLDTKFPFCDYYYKEKIDEAVAGDSWVEIKTDNKKKISKVPNVKLVAINTRVFFGSSREHTFDNFLELKTRLELPEQLQVDFFLCPKLYDSDRAKATEVTVSRKNVPDNTIINTYIIEIPWSFDRT